VQEEESECVPVRANQNAVYSVFRHLRGVKLLDGDVAVGFSPQRFEHKGERSSSYSLLDNLRAEIFFFEIF
jgi:hypothetical protein